MFAADLVRAIEPSVELSLEFITSSSYGNRTVSSGSIRIDTSPDWSPAGKNVLIVEDIIDSGRTLDSIVEVVSERGARSTRTIALLDKNRAPRPATRPDYIGFEIPDVFVVGYGLDFDGRFRHLPDVHELQGIDR